MLDFNPIQLKYSAREIKSNFPTAECTVGFLLGEFSLYCERGGPWGVSWCGLTPWILRGNADNDWRRLLEFSNMSDEEWVSTFEELDHSEE